MAAVGELEKEYAGQVEFEIVSAEETAKRGPEIERYGLGSHGLVGFASNGRVAATLPGHQYGRQEIVEVIESAMR